jgi:hypothetical protein
MLLKKGISPIKSLYYLTSYAVATILLDLSPFCRDRPRQRRGVELLDTRELLASLVVTSLADSGPGTLRWSIIELDAGTDPNRNHDRPRRGTANGHRDPQFVEQYHRRPATTARAGYATRSGEQCAEIAGSVRFPQVALLAMAAATRSLRRSTDPKQRFPVRAAGRDAVNRPTSIFCNADRA